MAMRPPALGMFYDHAGLTLQLELLLQALARCIPLLLGQLLAFLRIDVGVVIKLFRSGSGQIRHCLQLRKALLDASGAHALHFHQAHGLIVFFVSEMHGEAFPFAPAPAVDDHSSRLS